MAEASESTADAVRLHVGDSPGPAAADVEMQRPLPAPAAFNEHMDARQQTQQHQHPEPLRSNTNNGQARAVDNPRPGKQASVPTDEHQQKVARERVSAHAMATDENSRMTRLLRWWKHTRLYEFTSTGHEDACGFECSRVAGRRGNYWPPMFKEEDLKRSRWLRVVRFYTFYIRPALWMVVVLLISLYFFALMNNFATWLTNHEADEYNYNPPSGLDTQRPASEQLTGTIGSGGMFKLDDLTHRLIPQASGTSYTRWHLFVDYSLVIAMVVSVLFRFAMRDMVRLGEWAAVIIVLFILNGFVHVLTQYPDPWGSNGSCQDPDIRTYGSWIWNRFNTDYCGDQMWSGHTLNFIVALIMLRRVLYDLIGWDSVQLTTLTHSAASYRRQHDLITQLGAGHAGGPKSTADESATARSGSSTTRGNDTGRGDHGADGFHPAILPAERSTCNPKVLTQWPDVTSLPGVDKSNEALEATQNLPIGSAVLMCVRLAEAEGLGQERALEIARLLRLPVHGFESIEAQDSSLLSQQLRDPDEQKLLAEAANTDPLVQSNAHVRGRGQDAYSINGQLDREAKAAQLSDALMRPAESSQQKDASALLSSNAENDGGKRLQMPVGSVGQRVVTVSNGVSSYCGMASLPPHASRQPADWCNQVPAPLLQRTAPFALSNPIPASHGGPHVGGHYGAPEGAINLSSLRKSERGQSDLPCPEWDDVRGHGLNAFYRYRMNMPVRERIIMSRAPPPYFARRYPRATRWALNLFRVLLFCWTAVFLVGIIRIRYHYGADVMVSVIVTTLMCCNEKLLQAMVPYLYRPVDARYADAPIYPFSIDPQLYEETLSKLGVGGVI